MQEENNASTIPQYSSGKILAIWAAAAVPMAILGWVVAPALASGPPTGRQAFTTRLMALTVGLIWQFVLAMFKVFPFFAEPPGFSGRELLESREAQAQLVGAWGFLTLFAVNALFNTFLGEEFLLRGVLLPKMKGVFGKWDWLANGVLFGVYHLHQPWGIPGNIVSAAFLESYPARRFHSVWISIIVHSAQSVFFLFLLLGLVLGLA
jgi:membrane protease YdiL (CAAX protease family)